MQLDIKTFYDLTPRAFQNYFEGFQGQKERAHQEQWEQIRWLAFYAASGNLKKGTKPEQLLNFPWDNKTPVPASMPSQEEIEESKAYWQKIDQKRGESNN